jgi:hypothetical protein
MEEEASCRKRKPQEQQQHLELEDSGVAAGETA